MSELLKNSMFYEVLFPKDNQDFLEQDLQLRRTLRFQVPFNPNLEDLSFVVFDLETTGLDSSNDRIIEIGAQKIVNLQVVDEFSSLVQTTEPLSTIVEKLTGIRSAMLKGQPEIAQVLGGFLEFIKGSVLVAHNANFDMSFLKSECSRRGIDLSWPALCTLKMARKFLLDLESKTLDSIAQHYGFTFESRHRAIGDVKVTVSFLKELLSEHEGFPTKWKDCHTYEV